MTRPSLRAEGAGRTGIPDLPRPPAIKEFQEAVLDYYRICGRDLVWRRSIDPYHILVSEIMLQQTPVERASEKFPQFLAAFPDLPALAEASLADILAVWQGMGYNRRAIALQACARRIVTEYDGKVVQDPEVLETFPGIGRATAASICAFAFNMPVVFIETNIRRVFIHYFFDPDSTVDDRTLLPLAGSALYRKDPRTWYNALMDLGTDLKNEAGNANRRSRQYTKQASFEGSDRKIRGSIIRALIRKGTRTPAELAYEISEEACRVTRIIRDLKEEGFVTRSGNRYVISSR